MTLSQFVSQSIRALQTIYPEYEARNIVSALCSQRLHVQPWAYLTEPQTPISGQDADSLGSDMERLLDCEPLQYVLGKADFYGRTFSVGPGVLVPRPETEMLVEKVLSFARTLEGNVSILDLCTGSGCIAWTLQKELPCSEVVAVDVSEEALSYARRQFVQGPSPRFELCDVLSGVSIPGSFDIVVSNPPYVMEKEKTLMRRNVLDWEPGLALFVPDSDPLLFYRAVARWSKALMTARGRGFVEMNESLGVETAAVFEASGYRDVSVFPDLSGRNRFVTFG